VSWALFARDAVRISATPRSYASSGTAQRHFCGACGTSLLRPTKQTLDDPGALPLQSQIQIAERIGWMQPLDDLADFECYPARA
jgi:hypothetical protein